MERVRGGDEEAFRVLVERHENRMLAFFYRRLGDAETAEDLTLEVFHKIYRARQSYRPQARFTTFLYRVARNHWIDFLRVQAGKPRRSLSLDQTVEASDGHGARLGDLVRAPGGGPESHQTNVELGRKIREGLKRLNPGEASVFQLAVYDDLKYAQISDILGVPVGTVKSRMHTAMRKLRAWLEKEGWRP